ncbi:hypothetical protein DEQ92_20465 [Haloferax sp. Atlit-6N]|nr:hypothetical protein DEQ92_20465 [Haloferax sp. Atlit-6N]
MSVQPSTNSPANAWASQDGQVVARLESGGRSHAQRRWDERCPPEWEEFSVRAAWLDGEPWDVPGDDSAARLHKPSGMLVISTYGFLTSVVCARWRGYDE